MNIDKYNSFFSEHYKPETNNLEEVILGLRNCGASQIDSIRVLMNHLGLSLSDADAIILNSKTWSDNKDLTDKFRDQLGEQLNDME